jgi:spore maturation protein A
MIMLGIITFLIKGDASGLVSAMTASAERSVQLLIGLAGIMAVWSGLIKVCEQSGAMEFLAKLLRLPMRLLFPGLSRRSPKAQGSIIMNIASNMLGLSNAATPMGIKAMEELQHINPDKEKASDYMVTFLIVNAACIQLLPTTVISIRAGFNSESPGEIILPTIAATSVALIFGLISAKIFKRLGRRGKL